MDFQIVQVFWHLHEVQRSGVDDNSKQQHPPQHTHKCTHVNTQIYVHVHPCTHIWTHTHTHRSASSILQNTPRFSSVLLPKAVGILGEGLSHQLSLRHPTPPFLQSHGLPPWQVLWRIVSARVSPSILSLQPLGSLGMLPWGSGRQPSRTARVPPERPCPSLGTSNPQPHVASRWGTLLGKSPSFPPETQDGCKRGLSVHPVAVALAFLALLLGVDPTREGVGFLMAWVLS